MDHKYQAIIRELTHVQLEHGLTDEQMALHCGVGKATYLAWLDPENPNTPSLKLVNKTLRKVADDHLEPNPDFMDRLLKGLLSPLTKWWRSSLDPQEKQAAKARLEAMANRLVSMQAQVQLVAKCSADQAERTVLSDVSDGLEEVTHLLDDLSHISKDS